MANIAYIRVSSVEQNTGRQHELFKGKGIQIERIFEEKVSGKSTEGRPVLKAMMDYLREGDILYIESVSRLARNAADFLRLVDELGRKGVGLVSMKENIDTSTAQGKFITTVFAALYELERENIKERQQEGIALCLKEGRAYGRPKTVFTEAFVKNYEDWKAKRITTKEFMEREGITKRSSFYSKVKRYEERKQEE